MKLDKDIKRKIIKIIMNAVDYNEAFDVCSIVGCLIEDGEWDGRIEPADAYKQIRDIIEALIPIIEYKAKETEEGFVYTPYPI